MHLSRDQMTTAAIQAVAIVPEKHSWEDSHRGATPGEDGAWSLAASLSSLLPSKKEALSSALSSAQQGLVSNTWFRTLLFLQGETAGSALFPH